MKTRMRRFLLLLLAWSSSVGTAAAVESGSLLSQNSFGLYYLEDPFDLTLNPAFISEIDRWRLFTNLSNYEEGNSYLVGTSGRLGSGSLGLFAELDREMLKETSEHASDLTTDYPSGMGGPNDVLTTAESEASRFETESNRQAFTLTYGRKFGSFSLGASYRPTFTEGKTTLKGSLDEDPDYDGDPLWWSRPSFATDIGPGANYAWSRSETRSGQGGQGVLQAGAESEAFEGNAESDEDRHVLELGAQIRAIAGLPVWIRLGAASVKRTVNGSGAYRYSLSERGKDPYGFVNTESRTSTWAGNPLGSSGNHAFDGTEWFLDVVPRYALGKSVTLELGMGLGMQQGDVTARWSQDVAIDRTLHAERSETWQGTQHLLHSFDGDGEATSYSVAPRLYLSYGAAEFALGLAYTSTRDEVDGKQRSDGTMSWSHADGRDGDWIYEGSTTARGDRSLEFSKTVVSFPVATRFKVTDKLELRAGAEFTQVTERTKTSITAREDEQFTIRDSAGRLLREGPATRGSTDTTSLESSSGTTRYRLGAGYRATENLQFDLLFSRSRGDGGVDTTVVYASAVLAF